MDGAIPGGPPPPAEEAEEEDASSAAEAAVLGGTTGPALGLVVGQGAVADRGAPLVNEDRAAETVVGAVCLRDQGDRQRHLVVVASKCQVVVERAVTDRQRGAG